jgi:hypothetical protein
MLRLRINAFGARTFFGAFCEWLVGLNFNPTQPYTHLAFFPEKTTQGSIHGPDYTGSDIKVKGQGDNSDHIEYRYSRKRVYGC